MQATKTATEKIHGTSENYSQLVLGLCQQLLDAAVRRLEDEWPELVRAATVVNQWQVAQKEYLGEEQCTTFIVRCCLFFYSVQVWTSRIPRVPTWQRCVEFCFSGPVSQLCSLDILRCLSAIVPWLQLWCRMCVDVNFKRVGLVLRYFSFYFKTWFLPTRCMLNIGT